MIISANSIFRLPPTCLVKDQVVVFNSICYSIDICEIAFERLKSNLFSIVFSEQKPSFPVVFADAWTIIQNAAIFYKIIRTHFRIPKEDEVFKILREVVSLRNTYEHLDARILEVFIEKELPVFGKLSWYAQGSTDACNGIITSLYSGIYTDKSGIELSPSNPSGISNSELVSQIKLESVVKPKQNVEKYEITSIELDKLILNLKSMVFFFEEQINKQVLHIDITERHKSDLIVRQFVDKVAVT